MRRREFLAGGVGAALLVPAAPEDRSPRGGNQFFGMGEVDPASGALTMSIHDLNGVERFRTILERDA